MLFPFAMFGAHPATIQSSSIFAIILLGVAGSGLAYLLYYDLLTRISSTHVVAVTYLLPIWGLFWGYIAHEPIRWTAFVGVAIVISGLVLLNMTSLDKVKAFFAIGTQKTVEVEQCDAS